MKKTIVLYFKGASKDQPIVYRLSRDFNLTFNILKAKISPDEDGLMVLELTGDEKDYNAGIEYLKGCDIVIEPIERDVSRIEEKCLHCGMCTTMCPTYALDVNRETMEIIFDASKCIGCGACVKICPPRAMVINL